MKELAIDDAGRLVARVDGGPQRPLQVRVGLAAPNDPPHCTCTVGAEGRCRHVWAVLDRFIAAAGQRIGQDKAERGRDGGGNNGGSSTGGGRDGHGRDGRDGRGRDGRGRNEPRPRPWTMAAPTAQPPRAPAGPVRLSFRVGRVASLPTLELYEQERRGDGSWTPPRRVPPERLRDESLWSRPEIEAVARLVQTASSEPGAPAASSAPAASPATSPGFGVPGLAAPGLDAAAALEQLVGARDVTWVHAPGKPVSVVRAEVSVQLIPSTGGYRLEPVIGDRPLDPDELGRRGQDLAVVVKLDPHADKVLVGRIEPRAATVLQQLAATRPVIPPGGQLAQRLLQLERVVPVRLPASLDLPVVKGDTRIRLGLAVRGRGEGIEAGVHATLRTRPGDLRGGEPGAAPPGGDASGVTGEAGPGLTPGEGRPELVGGSVELGLARVKRDLAAERDEAEDVAELLGLADKRPSAPWTWDLDADEAIALVDAAHEAGARIVIEWADSRRLVGTRPLELRDLKVNILDQGDWFALEGSLLIDGERVSLALVLAALRDNSALVKLPGGRTLRLSDALRARLLALRDAVHIREGRLEVDAVGAPQVRDALAGADVDASEAWNDLLARFDASLEVSSRPPAGLKADLRPYQREGYAWLKRLSTWGAGACLADDMGLGKTVQAIAVLLDRARLGPALVVAPTSVSDNWVRELERFAPTMRPVLLRETDRAATTLSGLGPKDVLIASYDLARIDIDELVKVQWATLVLDEAQRVKNASTKTSQALTQLKAGWRMALTGTPIENHLGELWSLFRLVSPGLLGSQEAFRDRFQNPIERDRDAQARAALARRIKPFVLRRMKAEVAADLPPRTDVRKDVTLSDAERALYDATRLEAVRKLDRLVGVGNSQVAKTNAGAGGVHMQVLTALLRLRQISCHAGMYEDARWTQPSSSKLDAFVELALELKESEHRALVFSQFTKLLDLCEAPLRAARLTFVRLDGSTPAKDRQAAIDAFQRGDVDLFLISLKAGGTGLNLTAADHVVHLDPWWNPAAEDQATDRAHRIGQTKPVTVYRLVTKGTIEEQILALHEDKRNLVASILDDTDRAGSLTTSELLDLIRGGDPPPKRREARTSKTPDPAPSDDDDDESESDESESESDADDDDDDDEGDDEATATPSGTRRPKAKGVTPGGTKRPRAKAPAKKKKPKS